MVPEVASEIIHCSCDDTARVADKLIAASLGSEDDLSTAVPAMPMGVMTIGVAQR